MSIKYIKKFDAIFWDFDGVIKESVEVKSDAFEKLFLPFGKYLAKKVRVHHEAHGGMSRFEKLPIYLEWTGKKLSDQLINEYSERFSKLVKQKVIDSDWVYGVLYYLKNYKEKQTFFLITATPQQEIEEIMINLNIENYFEHIIGFPTKKRDAIKTLLDKYSINPEHAVMIGDSISDYEAAVINHMPFVLRETNLNKNLQKKLNCLVIVDYC